MYTGKDEFHYGIQAIISNKKYVIFRYLQMMYRDTHTQIFVWSHIISIPTLFPSLVMYSLHINICYKLYTVEKSYVIYNTILCFQLIGKF